MNKSFGEILFSDIDNNTYLNELYSNILYNYSLRLFNITKFSPKPININHALRFADILSKSVDKQKSETHKIWSQEIVALLYTLYPKNANVQYYTGAVLTSIENYRGLELQTDHYDSAIFWDKVYSNFTKEMLQIPAEPTQHFFRAQKKVYDNLDIC